MLKERLQAMKNASGLTLQQISDKSGVPLTTVSRIMQGTTENPEFDIVCKLVRAMGGSLDELDEDKVRAEAPEALTQLYERGIAYRDRKIQHLGGIIFIMVTVMIIVLLAIIGILVYDMTHLDRGWITGFIGSGLLNGRL